MISWDRVLAALRCEEPDRVPYCEVGVDRKLVPTFLGWQPEAQPPPDLEYNNYTVDEIKDLASFLRMDNIRYRLRAPVYANKVATGDGQAYYGDGLIKDAADLDLVNLPDPDDPALLADLAGFASQRGDYCLWLITWVGISPAYLGMGIERFSIALYESLDLVEELMDRYADWAATVAGHACRLGFDVIVTTDDLGFKTGPLFSPRTFRELFLPRFQRVAQQISVPWIVHSDGDISLYMDDLVELGISGLHPLEKGAMDIRAVKRRYGDRLCLLGNVDLNLLGMATPQEVDREVRELIRDVGPGGGYIVTSGNALAPYLLPENVLAMVDAVQRYGQYPLADL